MYVFMRILYAANDLMHVRNQTYNANIETREISMSTIWGGRVIPLRISKIRPSPRLRERITILAVCFLDILESL